MLFVCVNIFYPTTKNSIFLPFLRLHALCLPGCRGFSNLIVMLFPNLTGARHTRLCYERLSLVGQGIEWAERALKREEEYPQVRLSLNIIVKYKNKIRGPI